MVPLPFRRSVRALLVTPADEVLLVRHETEVGPVWVPPGGGVEPGEDDVEALRRELREELGLLLDPDVRVRPVWTQRLPLDVLADEGIAGYQNHASVLAVDRFEPHPAAPPGAQGSPEAEGITGMRRWTWAEMADAASRGVLFGPRDLPARRAQVLAAARDDALPAPAFIDGP